MKAASFGYVRPGSVAAVLDHLGEDGAKVIAGGQSLVPVLAMRLAAPTTLVDINAVPTLRHLETLDGTLRIGAAVPQRQVEWDPQSRAVPLLRLALPWVGHRELRSRGTVCGSLAHADPAAELPAVAACLRAVLTVAGRDGDRTVPAEDFFRSAMTTAVTGQELLTRADFPVTRPGDGYGFAEVARRHGDFALAGVVVHVNAANPDRPTARVAAFGVASTPVARDVTPWLRDALTEAAGRTGGALREAAAAGAVQFADDVVHTVGDYHGSAAYRRQLVAALSARELTTAYERAVRTNEGKPT